MSSTSNINPKPCNYGCNTRIYWDVNQNTYFEVFSQKRHICPNILKNNNNKPIIPTTASTTTSNTKPTYYSKKPWNRQQSKPQMSNSFEYLQGSIAEIQKKYEILSDIGTEYNGKVHGSQRDRDPKTGLIDLLVYYEVPSGHREEVKRKFENYVFIAMSG
jgi:hypothetical protein